ncbi:hypothetical protein [Mycobacteroides abscessus]|uniref:hypothetical protein n=1 Tax=Mycobacteroides abscessus TaxID=36809 RepID=UPI0010575F54|nr:hypothetical protein [Mycobacteroides abscessus]
MFAAANSVPEGAPVGTIARRPDGAWKAERKAGEAGPYWQYSTSAFWQADSPDWNSEDDADSWPVIYDPGEDKAPRLAEAASKTKVFGEDRLDLIDPIHAHRSAQQEPALRERFPEQASAYVADPELAEVDNEPLPSGSLITPNPRTPRVVYRLGVDEQGSRWQDRQLGEWKFDGQAWRYLELTWTSVPGGEWVEAEPSKRYGPYVEVLS